MNSKRRIIYTKNCLEFLDYRCVTPNDKDFRIYEGKNSVIPSMVDVNFNDGFLNNWNWIMEVVEAIEKKGYFVMINKWTSVYTGKEKEGERIEITTIEGKNKKVNTVQAINQFLIWYNNEH